MKLTNSLIASTLFLAMSSVATAATDSTDIEILVTKDAYVNFTGSLQGNQTVTLGLADVDATTTSLGTLGTESNTTGGCDIAFSSLNDFKLLNTTAPGVFLHGANQYTIDYDGTNIASGAPNTIALGSCNNIDSSMDMNTPALPAVVTAGTYRDLVTVTVTTQ